MGNPLENPSPKSESMEDIDINKERAELEEQAHEFRSKIDDITAIDPHS